MTADDEVCGNCRFAGRPERLDDDELIHCHRHAPRPYSILLTSLIDVVADIGRSARKLSFIPLHKDPLKGDFWSEVTMAAEAATELQCWSIWPVVNIGDWCGDWKPKKKAEEEETDG